MNAYKTPLLGLLLGLVLLAATPMPYPIDGYSQTGIRRLERLRLITEGKLGGNKPPPGAMKAWGDITLHLADDAEPMPLPEPDAELQKQVTALFPNRDASYSIAILDITPGKPVRLARHKWENTYQPGSVAKIAVAAGLFAELKTRFPNDTEARRLLLKERMVQGGRWVRPNSHTVPVFDPETKKHQSRIVYETDVFNLYEWADHMISASSNAAASVVWKEALLMRAFGANYPPTPEQEAAFFKDTPKSQLREMAMSVVNDPLRAAGVAKEDFQLGSFFTSTASSIVPSGGSYGNPRGLLTFLLRVEEGQIVDPWSSLEIKRLMYSTERRIRYASAPALATSALYFKSGSLYKCKAEEGFTCSKYHGNVHNYMNSVATVETPDGRVYLVALMSNVLRKNSAYEHQVLATSVEKVMAAGSTQPQG